MHRSQYLIIGKKNEFAEFWGLPYQAFDNCCGKRSRYYDFDK